MTNPPPRRSSSLSGRAASAFESLGAGALGLMALVAFADVVLRVAGAPITGAYELTAILVAIVVYAGLPRVTHGDTHVRAGLFGESVAARPRLQRALRWLRNGLTAATMGLLTWAMTGYALRVGAAGDRAPYIELPLAWVAGFGAVALVLCCALALRARDGDGAELG